MRVSTFLSILSVNLAVVADPIIWPGDDADIVLINAHGPGCPCAPDENLRCSITNAGWGSLWRNPEETDSLFSRGLNLPSTMGANTYSNEKGTFRSTWCEHEWKFRNTTGYRVNVSKNGTAIYARYQLAPGFSAVWNVTYTLPDGTQSVDTVEVNGPLGSFEKVVRADAKSAAHSLTTGCTEKDHTIKIRTEVSLVGPSSGQSGIWGAYDYDIFNRIQQVLTFNYEKCE
ncbi:hypothetical protein P154DRAFT_530513 [Amniculicola lignicola CBS 123094]|uniref:Uncharacterized protein n=1 Tax=Amniculicola lignicola CBS 123094 TaxID=1392246 RepID=A0A6A5WXI7_9PLEO|nr:hypothetical protein P154DRAFT_530513 [Amniculicola lignicola CBS 123094]